MFTTFVITGPILGDGLTLGDGLGEADGLGLGVTTGETLGLGLGEATATSVNAWTSRLVKCKLPTYGFTTPV